MTLIEPVVRGNLLELNYPGMEALAIKLPEGEDFEAMERVKVAVHAPRLAVNKLFESLNL